MRLARDPRSIKQQIKSGIQIAAAILATFAGVALIGFAHMQITKGDSSHHVLVGWLLIGALVVILSTTVQFWCRWYEPKISALVLSGFGDLVLWLQWHVIWKPRVRTSREELRLELSFRLLTTDLSYAPTASCPPSGRKYCVPLIGSVTLRNSSCRSSLRSTKSISDVFTISRSDDV